MQGFVLCRSGKTWADYGERAVFAHSVPRLRQSANHYPDRDPAADVTCGRPRRDTLASAKALPASPDRDADTDDPNARWPPPHHRPVTRFRVVYRKQLVTGPGETHTVTRQVTDSRVVTRQVTVATTTVVSTKTDTLPVTITVTVP